MEMLSKDNVDTAILEPNDMIYIPHRKMHRLEIIEPRISVSFSARIVEETIYEIFDDYNICYCR